MTRDEAKKQLYNLWHNGKIPYDFTEDHPDFEKAIEYVIINKAFDYEDFTNSIAIIKFGIWQVESDGLIAKDGQDYFIESSRLWETSEYNGHLVWSWLIHLARKSWINKNNVKDLNIAFLFCLDFFRDIKPKNLPYVSTSQTLYIQNQILEIQKIMEKDATNLDSLLKYRDLMSNIKFL